MDEKQRETFNVRVPVKISQADDGTIIVHEYKYISYFCDRGNDTQMFPHEYAAFCDLMLDKTIRWTEANASGAQSINRHADLYFWWNAFIEGPLSQVPIGEEQFRKSRAGLIHHTLMNSIRKAANLSPADFKALSLAEVFAVIEDIHCREHNEENRLRHQATERKPDAAPPKPPAETLPFSLQRCDVPQTLKRESYKPVIIENEDYWKLMEALMAAYPNAVPESKLKHLFPYNADQRKNARRKLNELIDSLGLTVSNWVLTEVKT